MTNVRTRFWSKVNRQGPTMPHMKTCCWLWEAGTNKGYGIFQKTKGEQVRSNRMSWEIGNGPIPSGMNVLHKCDNKLCVRGGHLFLGSYADNSRDMVTKGRSAHGATISLAKLTDCKVERIRLLHNINPMKWSIRYFASRYGVSGNTVWRAIKGRTWKHVR